MRLRSRTLAARLWVVTSLLALALPARAVCPQDGATPFTAGPVDPANGFARWVQDSQGVALALCLDGDGATGPCFFDPPIADNPFSQQIGFGPEAFWWLTEAALDTTATDPTTGDTFSALVVMAVEAAFLSENPAPGEQFPFTRLRLRVDVPRPGVYTVTHPFGEESFTVAATEDGRDVNENYDIEFLPNAVNQGRVGPWLRHADAPAGYVGHGNARTAPVIGSPCGTNFFRITATNLAGTGPVVIDPADLDGDGRTDSITTRDFAVFGKILPGTQVPTPLTVDGATYSRSADGRVNLFATAPTTAAVTFTGGPNLPAGPISTATDGTGRFFGTVAVADASTLPREVNVTATNAAANNGPTTVRAEVKDVVTITLAEARCAGTTCTLQIEAASSDLGSPPTLTASWPGQSGVALSAGVLTTPPFPRAAVPATVTVSSSAGGSDSEPARVVHVQ
jgi:hypothetical protein